MDYRHSAAPWRTNKLKQWRSEQTYLQVVDAHGRVIVNGCAPGGTLEANANARLMASAPDLLEACTDVLKDPESGPYLPSEQIKKLHEAIAKATSERIHIRTAPNPLLESLQQALSFLDTGDVRHLIKQQGNQSALNKVLTTARKAIRENS